MRIVVFLVKAYIAHKNLYFNADSFYAGNAFFQSKTYNALSKTVCFLMWTPA